MQVKTKNLVVGALVVLLVGMVWYRVVYSSMESKASSARSAAHDAETNAKNLRQALDDTTSSKKKAKTHDASTAELTKVLPADAAEATFLRDIEALRVGSGADWQSVTPSPPTVVGTVSTINVAITVQGSEAQIARYTSGLSGLPRAFILDNIAITQGGSASAPGTPSQVGHAGATFQGDLFQAQISGRIFSQATAVAPVATGTTGTGGSATTPVTGAPAPTGGSSGPSGVQNN